MSTIIQDLNDNQPRVVSAAEAITVAKQAHISRFVKSDFGYAEVSCKMMASLLALSGEKQVIVRKAPKFSFYYFSKP